ncbi:MAG: hypothetical protein K6G90_08775 [Clostridia bacterium]|nr:hypothetical protein [Clostridia bacterium]
MIEKMLLLRVAGPMDKLGNILLRLCLGADIHLENAADALGRAEGYIPVSGESPFTAVTESIRAISDAAGDPIDDRELTSALTAGKEASDEYVRALHKCLEDAEDNFDQNDINVFLSGLKPRLDEYIKKISALDTSTAELNHSLDLSTHFSALDIDIAAVRRELKTIKKRENMSATFGLMPKDSAVKLYLLNAEDKFFFKAFARDESRVWGIRCASDENAAEARAVFDTLGFERFPLPSSPEAINKTIAADSRRLADIKRERESITEFWSDNRRSLTRDLSMLLDLERIWKLRSYAAVKDGLFHIVGWIRAKTKKDVTDILKNETGVEYFIRKPEEIAKANAAEPFPFEENINDIEYLARETNADLGSGKLFNILGTERDLTPEYTEQFSAYLGGGGIGRSGEELIPPALRGEIRVHANERRSIHDERRELKKKISRLSHFLALGVNIEDVTGTKYIKAAFGRLPRKAAEEILANDNREFEFEIYSSDDRTSWCIWAALTDKAEAVADRFDALYFKKYDFSGITGTPREAIARLEEELKALDERSSSLSDFWNANEHNILMSYSILLDLQKLWNARGSVRKKNDRFIFAGNVPKADKREMTKLLETFGGFDASEDAAAANPAATPPTRLRNLRLFSPYEYFVGMYGMPSYGSVDITPFVAVTYTLLFGTMFGDLGQGAVLILIGVFMWLKKKMALGKILIPCGAASMVGGLVFGSVFGYEELLDPLYHAVGMAGKPVSVMESINGVLVFAIFTGIALVCLSILLNIFTALRERRFGAAVFGTNGVAGLALYVCGVSLVYDFMAKKTLIPGRIAIPVMAVCAVILFLQEWIIGLIDRREFRIHGSVSDFIMQNFFELIEYVLSYFSNTVSFLRVGAFVLVHAGMMMVVFSLAGESRNVFVIILGNILVIALEGLLSGIQALRLEYYEMFSRCYTGGGKEFESISTKIG